MKRGATMYRRPLVGGAMHAGMPKAFWPVLAGVALSGALINTLCTAFFSLGVPLAGGVSVVIAFILGAIGVRWVVRSESPDTNHIDVPGITRAGDVAYHTAILDEVRDAIVGSDLSFTLNFWNKAAEALYGWTADEVQGRTESDLLDTNFVHAGGLHGMHELAARGSWRGEATQKRKDGTSVLVEVQTSTLHDTSGNPAGYVSIHRDISERKRGEEESRRRMEEVQKLMELTPAAVWVADDPECLHITGNRAGNQFYEAADQENVSANSTGVRRFFRQGREIAPHELPMQEAARTGQDVRDAELDVLLPSGKWITILGSATPLRGPAGIVRGCIGAFVDITNRKQTEQALQKSQEQFRLLFHNMFNGFALCQMHYDDGRPVDFTYLDVNAAFETITGLKNVTGKRVSEVIPGIREANPELFDIYGRVAETGRPETFESYVSGLGMWLSIAVHSPATGLFVAIFEDVTERKEKEVLLTSRLDLMNHAASQPLEELLQETLNWVTEVTHSPIAFCHLVDPDQTTVSLQAWSTRNEFRTAEGHVVHFGEEGGEAWKEAIRGGKPVVRNEIPLPQNGTGLPEGPAHMARELVVPISRNGLIVAVLGVGNKAVPYADHDVKIATYFADIIWEIAELKRAEQALVRNEERFRVAAQSLSDVVYEWDLADKIDWYGNIDALLGFSPGEFPRSLTAWFDRIHEEDKPLVSLAIEGHLKGDIAYNCEYRVQAKNGDWRHWSARGVALRYPSGKPYRWIGSITDITDQVNA